ncbi:MAG: hypothetical protein HY894_05790 [Deltaproteobacteria bacterium]|nr:hypothetical protein [Deltaproteobacteria bacterium]
MFLGHYAVGLAAKRFSPGASLGTLLFAALWGDLLWSALLLAGVERVRIVPGFTGVSPFVFEYYPWSHSLAAALFWAGCFVLVCRAFRGSARAAFVLGALVLSHWFLDAAVHRPDLPIGFAGQARAGLGVWDSSPATLVLEGALFVIGAWFYFGSTRPMDSIGRYAAMTFAGLLVIIYAGQFAGVSPPDVDVAAKTGLAQAFLILFGFWVDRRRHPKV